LKLPTVIDDYILHTFHAINTTDVLKHNLNPCHDHTQRSDRVWSLRNIQKHPSKLLLPYCEAVDVLGTITARIQ